MRNEKNGGREKENLLSQHGKQGGRRRGRTGDDKERNKKKWRREEKGRKIEKEKRKGRCTSLCVVCVFMLN